MLDDTNDIHPLPSKTFEQALEEKQKGDTFLKEKKNNEAIEQYNSALDIVKAFMEKKDKEELATDFEEVKNLMQKVAIPSHMNLSLCYFNLNLYEKCIYECNLVLKIDSKNTKALFRKCTCQIILGNIPEAKKDYQSLSTLLPDSAEILNLKEKIEQKEAEQDLEKNSVTSLTKEQIIDFVKKNLNVSVLITLIQFTLNLPLVFPMIEFCYSKVVLNYNRLINIKNNITEKVIKMKNYTWDTITEIWDKIMELVPKRFKLKK